MIGPQGKVWPSLLESRAKGFAAEFLIPAQGVASLLGTHTKPETAISVARSMVGKVVDVFKTPWEITSWHLKNLGLIENSIVQEVIEDQRPLFAPLAPLSLPQPGKPPLCLSEVAYTGEQGTWQVRTPTEFVRESRQFANEIGVSLGDALINAAYEHVVAGRPNEATNMLVEHLDALLLANEFVRAQAILERLDPNRMPPAVLTGVLTATWWAKERLGQTRAHLYVRVMEALELTWNVSADRRERIAQRLR